VKELTFRNLPLGNSEKDGVNTKNLMGSRDGSEGKLVGPRSQGP
jgi:hypothetical protein